MYRMCVVPGLVLLYSSLALGHRFEPAANKELWVPGWKPLLDTSAGAGLANIVAIDGGVYAQDVPPPNVLLTPSGWMGRVDGRCRWVRVIKNIALHRQYILMC